MAESNGRSLRGYDPKHGANAQFLAAFMGMGVQTLRNRLQKCPTTRVGRYHYYDPAEAMQFLVDPKIDIDLVLRTTKPEDLPVKFQKEYWTMRKARMEVEREASELWRTEDVHDALIEIFQAIKRTVQLWPDRLAREQGITAEQRDLLMSLSDEFQDEVQNQIEKSMDGFGRRSLIEDIEGADEKGDATVETLPLAEINGSPTIYDEFI